MSNTYAHDPKDKDIWDHCNWHPHDIYTETEEDFWDICIDDEIFDEDEEQGDDPLEGK